MGIDKDGQGMTSDSFLVRLLGREEAERQVREGVAFLQHRIDALDEATGMVQEWWELYEDVLSLVSQRRRRPDLLDLVDTLAELKRDAVAEEGSIRATHGGYSDDCIRAWYDVMMLSQLVSLVWEQIDREHGLYRGRGRPRLN